MNSGSSRWIDPSADPIPSRVALVPIRRQRRSSKDYLLPSTFEERGAAVPFTTPALAFSRIREDWRGRLELAIDRFGGAAGCYIVPLDSVRDLVPLTAHDTVLQQELLTRNATDPATVRLAALEVASLGLAGPELEEAARSARTTDEDSRALNEVLLIVQTIRGSDRTDAQSLLSEALTPAGQTRIRSLRQEVATRLKLPVSELDARLSALAYETFRIGLSWSPAKGHVRRLIEKLEQLRRTTDGWTSGVESELGTRAGHCADAVTQTLDLARETLGTLDRILYAPIPLLHGWDKRFPQVQTLVRRLAWLMDGWEPIAELWSGRRNDAGATDTLADIIAVLPSVPRSEFAASKREASAEADRTSRRSVRLNEEWRSGTLDMEMVRRIELLRANAFGPDKA